ncbi:MAG: ABC transporter [Amphiamblys sp. WSBS2006]|nr:MAG: ABC transporter [Amphiamblys sp. WSBS2006]
MKGLGVVLALLLDRKSGLFLLLLWTGCFFAIETYFLYKIKDFFMEKDTRELLTSGIEPVIVMSLFVFLKLTEMTAGKEIQDQIKHSFEAKTGPLKPTNSGKSDFYVSSFCAIRDTVSIALVFIDYFCFFRYASSFLFGFTVAFLALHQGLMALFLTSLSETGEGLGGRGNTEHFWSCFSFLFSSSFVAMFVYICLHLEKTADISLVIFFRHTNMFFKAPFSLHRCSVLRTELQKRRRHALEAENPERGRCLEFVNLTIEKNYRVFLQNFSLVLGEKHSMFVFGLSGTGKTLLAKRIEKTSVDGSGAVFLPSLAGRKALLCFSHTPHLVGGSLMDQLLFPFRPSPPVGKENLANISEELGVKKHVPEQSADEILKKTLDSGTESGYSAVCVQKAKHILSLLRLEHLEEKFNGLYSPRDLAVWEGLSGGEKERLMAARALMQRPSVVVFDSFFNSLQEKEVEEVLFLFSTAEISTVFFSNKICFYGDFFTVVVKLEGTGAFLVARKKKEASLSSLSTAFE